MSEPIYELPETIELDREQYRQRLRALEVAEEVLDEPALGDPSGSRRSTIESAILLLLTVIWPDLDEF